MHLLDSHTLASHGGPLNGLDDEDYNAFCRMERHSGMCRRVCCPFVSKFRGLIVTCKEETKVEDWIYESMMGGGDFLKPAFER
jgi:hypothetical protein